MPANDALVKAMQSQPRPAEEWQAGLATVKVVGDRVYILHKEGMDTYLIEARRVGKRRLVVRYLRLGNPALAAPWVGVVVDDERIDGAWRHGRWDLRRKLPAE